MAIAKSKRGAFFTFAAIALALVILISFNTYNTSRLEDDVEATEVRIATMNSFVKDLENSIGDAAFIVAFRTLLSLEDYMMDKKKFMGEDDSPNLAAGFEELFLYGTITTGVNTEGMGLMHNNSFFNWTERMKVQANKTGIELDFTVNDVSISHSSPWIVDVSVDLTIAANDKKSNTKLTINRAYTKKINITGFVDPLYMVNNKMGSDIGIVNNTIRITPVSPAEDDSDLNTHLLNSYYIEHTDAPSYLMRFENNLGSSPYGIESLVNSQKLIDKGLTARDRSAVDFIYYGAQSTTNCEVKDPNYSWFKLDKLPDPSHLDFYDAQCKGGGN